jgi:uncharacterized membrane protein
MNWLLLGLLFAALFVFLLFKMGRARTKIAYVFILIVVGFLVISLIVVYSGENVDLSNLDGVTHAAKLYFSWLGNLLNNLGRISGYAVSQNWTTHNPPKNITK